MHNAISMLRTAALAAVLFLAAAISAMADNYIIALPGDYAGDEKTIQIAVGTTFNGIHAGDTLSVYSAPDRKRIYYLALPDNSAYDNTKLRRKQFGRTLQPLGIEIKKIVDALAGDLPANIDLPGFLREIADSALPTYPSKTAQVLVIGSAKFFDKREPQFSTLDGHFPSDGHIRVDSNLSPFGAANRANTLRGVNVHLCLTDTDWIDELHKQRLGRFWSLYISAMGGTLASFTNDLGTCTQRFLEKKTDMPEHYVLDPNQTKPEMLRVVREAKPETAAATALPTATTPFEAGARFMDEGVVLSDTPPTTTIGQAKIGIRWDCGACDLDIYARASSQADFLFWKNQRTSEGIHNKDWTSSPDAEKQFEYIDFTTQVDLNKLEVYLHFYGGSVSGGPAGVIRLWFNGQVYEAPFHITASQGNEGNGATPHPETRIGAPEWATINIMELVKLSPVAVR